MVKSLIGLEIHAELSTKTKMFCACKNEFGATPNTNICPICLGHPGTLPRLNKDAVRRAILAGFAMDCKIRRNFQMDRKKYFYPDLTKGFQISQNEEPICYEGFIEITTDQGTKKVRIERIHIEEDTGKSNHTEDGSTWMDYNRAGVPLIEIVTYPDIENGEEARLFLEALKERLKWTDVSDVKMEEGSLRCDVNFNLIDGDKKTGITEIKNLNSFRAVERAIEFEHARHEKMLDGEIDKRKETRRWDDAKGETVHMRFKETHADYRLSIEGDLPRVELDEAWIDEIKKSLPELPHELKARFVSEYGLRDYDADVLSQNKARAVFFEEAVKEGADPSKLADWILTDVMRLLNESETEFEALKFGGKELKTLIALVEDGKINAKTGKKVLRKMFETGKNPDAIVKEEGLVQISDMSLLESVVDEVLAANQESVEAFHNGRDRALGYLMGECMKRTKGKGNPGIFNELLRKKLASK